MTTWFHCNDETGAIFAVGVSATVQEAQLQLSPEGHSLFLAEDGLVGDPFSPTPDFTRLRTWARAKIDAEANQVFLAYVTDIAGQDRRYMLKSQEALNWSEGDEVDHPERYIFMITEASIRSAVSGQPVTVAQVRAEIMAQIQMASLPEAAVEGAKVAYKLLAAEAATLPAIVAATKIDWQAILQSATGEAQA